MSSMTPSSANANTQPPVDPQQGVGLAQPQQQQPATPKKRPSLKERYTQLVIEHGPFKGTRYFFKPPPPPGVQAEEKLSIDVQILIYAVSLIALVVSGSQEIVQILKGNPAGSVIASIILGLFFIAVLSMDRSFARTIPRIPLLIQRGEWFMVIEHTLFALCVGAIEISSVFVLIINESNITGILTGHPLLAPNSQAFVIAAGARAALIVWTIAHSYLSGKALPPQFQAFKTAGAILIAQKLLDRINGLGDSIQLIRFRALYRTGVQMYSAPLSAPRQKRDEKGNVIKGYNRQAEQKTLDAAYEKELVDAFESLEAPAEAISPAIPPITMAQVLEAVQQAISASESTTRDLLERLARTVEAQLANLQKSLLNGTASTQPPIRIEAGPGQHRVLADFDEDSPEFEPYVLPDGIFLDTTDTVAQLASILGVPNSSLDKAFKENKMPQFKRRAEQPTNVKVNYAVWEVLAFVETGVLGTMPSNVSKVDTVPNSIGA